MRPQPCYRLRRRGNAGEVLAEAGKRQASLFSAREHFRISSTSPRCFQATSLGRRSLVWPASNEHRQRKVEELSGAFQATIYHADVVVGFVGTSLMFFDPPRLFLHHLELTVAVEVRPPDCQVRRCSKRRLTCNFGCRRSIFGLTFWAIQAVILHAICSYVFVDTCYLISHI